MVDRTNEEIYLEICRYRKTNGYSPSVRDLCRALGFRTTSTMYQRLVRMEHDGMITMVHGQSRTIVPRPREEWGA